MKLKFLMDFDNKRKEGYEVEIDRIRYDESYASDYAVRVVGQWKKPRWLSLRWFVEEE